MKDPVKDKLRRFELFDRFGAANFYPTIGSAVDAYLEEHAVNWKPENASNSSIGGWRRISTHGALNGVLLWGQRHGDTPFEFLLANRQANRRFEFQNAVSFSSACTTKRFPSSRCASTIQIVRPLESIAETQPQLQPALLRLSAMISQYFTGMACVAPVGELFDHPAFLDAFRSRAPSFD